MGIISVGRAMAPKRVLADDWVEPTFVKRVAVDKRQTVISKNKDGRMGFVKRSKACSIEHKEYELPHILKDVIVGKEYKVRDWCEVFVSETGTDRHTIVKLNDNRWYRIDRAMLTFSILGYIHRDVKIVLRSVSTDGVGNYTVDGKEYVGEATEVLWR